MLLICIHLITPIVLLLIKFIKRYSVNFYLGSFLLGLIILMSPSGITLINQRYLDYFFSS